VAKPYKSVLETYNEDKKPHRLPTAEEEAIEPVYPEEYLVGGPGKAVASGLSKAEKAAAKAVQRERIANVKIGSRVPNPEAVAADKAMAEEFAKTKWGKATYDDLRKRAEQVARDKSVGQIKDTARRSADRASTNFFGEAGTAIGSEMADQNRNAAGDTYKKGGMTASRRADGIASRGKTRGRIV
jgi:hypothetical protein